MADKEITIYIRNEIVASQSATNQIPTTPTSNPLTPPTSPGLPPSSGNSSGGKFASVMGAFSAQFAVEAGSKLLNATGNQQIAQAVSQVGRYVFLGARALSGDPIAIATLAIDVASKALQEVQKQSAIANEIDMTRAKAGVLNMSGVKITKNYFTGRYEYSRG